jgi:hypothetical protein
MSLTTVNPSMRLTKIHIQIKKASALCLSDNLKELEQSIRTKLYVLPGDTIVFPGHNDGMTPTSAIEQERRINSIVRG